MVLSVNGSHVATQSVHALSSTLERDRTEMAGFLCLEDPTKGMKEEAAKAGMFVYQGTKYPRLQIRTVKELLGGHAFDTPSRVRTLHWERQTSLAI